MLEAAGPLTALAAQLVYLGSPLLRPTVTDEQSKALAGMLEERDELRAFVAFLREEDSL